MREQVFYRVNLSQEHNMEVRKPINYGISFADSEIISYQSQDSNVLLRLRAWNSEIIEFEFVNCILFFILDSWDISEVCESSDSVLFQRALNMIYDEIPVNHNYRLFQFLNNDDDPVVEIACESINIQRKKEVT